MSSRISARVKGASPLIAGLAAGPRPAARLGAAGSRLPGRSRGAGDSRLATLRAGASFADDSEATGDARPRDGRLLS